MKTLKYTLNKNIDIPTSIACIGRLPENKFVPDFNITGDIWADILSDFICDVYLQLVINEVIQIDYIVKEHKIGFIKWEKIYYIPKVTNINLSTTPIGWFENQIINSIENYNPKNQNDYSKYLSHQIKLLFNNILGKGEVYAHPWKKIFEKIITYDKSGYVSYSYNKKYLNLVTELEVIIDSKNINLLNTTYSTVEMNIQQLQEDKNGNQLYNKLRNKIHKEIDRHQSKTSGD